MPILNILCPHCQRNIEVELTSLAHNSGCPACGKPLARVSEPVADPRLVVLEHVRERIRPDPVKRPALRRRRLLSPNNEEVVVEPVMATNELKAYQPQVMDDNVHERMWFDPEVQVRIKWLRWGGGILAGLLLFTVIADRMRWWNGVSQYFAGVTDKILRTSESNQYAAEANQNDLPGMPKSKPVFKRVLEPKVASGASNLPANNSVPQTEMESAMKTVTSFLRALTIKERIKFVRQQELWGPRMREYYVHNGDGPVMFDRVEALESGANGEANFTFSVVLPDGLRRNIVVAKSDKGDFLVDWASFVLYSEMDWDKFRGKRPTAPVTFRVLAMPSDNFKRAFSDSKNLVCLKLANPLNSAKPALYAYADRNSTVGRSLAFLMQTFSGKAIPLILRLKYPSSADTENQVLICEFVGEGWVASTW